MYYTRGEKNPQYFRIILVILSSKEKMNAFKTSFKPSFLAIQSSILKKMPQCKRPDKLSDFICFFPTLFAQREVRHLGCIIKQT